MADWVTISALATAGGTLALAGATYASVRSNNRSARLAEMALQEQRRPVLVHSSGDDHAQAGRFAGRTPIEVPGGGATVESDAEAVYLSASLRNVGAGIAVLQGWQCLVLSGAEHGSLAQWRKSTVGSRQPDIEDFRPLMQDQYIAGEDTGLWRGTVRNRDDPLFEEIAAALTEERPISLDLLYTDQVGGQRTISRFVLLPPEGEGWLITAARHWYLDAPAPR